MTTAPAWPTAEDFRACRAEVPRIVHTASGSMEYAERGHGEAVLAVHGTMGGWDQGLVSAEYLRLNGFRIIAPSRPGYLGTPLSTGRTPAQQGDALAALLDALKIESIIVFAGSGGGPTGYQLAARHSDRISKLVQVDAVSLTDKAPSPLVVQLATRDYLPKAQIWGLRHATKPTLTALLRTFGSYTKQVASEHAAILAAIPGRTAQLEATLAASLGGRRRAGTENDLTVSTPVSLERIACPTLIVHGRSDKVVLPAHAEHAHTNITGSKLCWIDGSHLAFSLEAADTAPAYVVNWLRDSL